MGLNARAKNITFLEENADGRQILDQAEISKTQKKRESQKKKMIN